jgi:hypothetical protein
VLPSSVLPFLNVATDGRKKDRHNREVLFLSALLRDAGVKDFCLHHVDEAGMNHHLPLAIDGKWYDIAYVAPDGEIFLIEVMRLKYARGPAVREDGKKWQKEKQSSLSSVSGELSKETIGQSDGTKGLC